ncbi:aminotransferase class V-fold PLP-dependent enzyme [Gorillibacterium massiliense]|uniref:aminotransferase class V-fold PLP-dependent enzyme n=1 Tax=Gorillibacterium massiliense TaxID=1280390 RepID=UPI0012DFB2D7|nr:aminotransferase class V-fold PLP-dependent enzyme [Gorillibacterium massiliense]
MKTTYFDHAASSWPKPPQVAQAVGKWVEDNGANPGRGSHRLAMDASRIIYDCRWNLADLLGVKNPLDIAFTANATMALNMALSGYLREGDHVISTELEHNSVRRPLEWLKRTRGVEVTYVPADRKGNIDLTALADAFRKNTRLAAVSHGSNVLGSILQVGEIGEMCRKKGVRLLVDAAQTAGALPIDVEKMNIDLLAFPGHKGLLGLQGTGGLYISPEIDLEPFMYGGTGGFSEETGQPDVRPDRYEAGTLNTPGIAGLNEGVKVVLQEGTEAIHRREWELSQLLMEGLMQVEGLELLGPSLGEARTGTVSFLLPKMDPSEMGMILDKSYGIAVRTGLHCSPLSHQTAGTLGSGAVRASIGFSTTRDEVVYVIQAVQEIARTYRD